MEVLRGRSSDPHEDRRLTAEMVEQVGNRCQPALRVWYPPAHVAFGRRDRTAGGYDRARHRALGRGYPPVERDVGGRAVAFTGEVLAVVLAEPTDDVRPSLDDRYERALSTLAEVVRGLGVDAVRGEPPDSFCPGTHSLQADGKIAGLAQRVRRDVAVVAAALVVRDADRVAAALEPVYDALDVPFDGSSVGSLAAAGLDVEPRTVRAAVEEAYVGERRATVRTVRDT